MSRCHDVIVTILNILTQSSVIVPIYPEIDEK